MVAADLIGFSIWAAYRSQSDFTIYRDAGLAVAAGRSIYDLHDWSSFQYAPIYPVFFIPFGLVSSRLTQLLWSAISVATARPAMILGVCRMLQGPNVKLTAGIVAVPLRLIARFLHPNSDHGAINLVVVAMIVWGLVFTRSQSPSLAGTLAASLRIKPFALPIMADLFLRKRFLALSSTTIFIVALLRLPGVFLGIRPTLNQTLCSLGSLLARIPLNRRSHHVRKISDQSASAIAVRLLASLSEASI